jgi:hypothetical protein
MLYIVYEPGYLNLVLAKVIHTPIDSSPVDVVHLKRNCLRELLVILEIVFDPLEFLHELAPRACFLDRAGSESVFESIAHELMKVPINKSCATLFSWAEK